jgi:hypothetical protein
MKSDRKVKKDRKGKAKKKGENRPKQKVQVPVHSLIICPVVTVHWPISEQYVLVGFSRYLPAIMRDYDNFSQS